MAPDIGASAAGSDIGLNTATNPRCHAPTSSQIRTTLSPGCRETVTVPTQYSPYWFLPSTRVHYGAAALEFRFTFVLSIYGSVGRDQGRARAAYNPTTPASRHRGSRDAKHSSRRPKGGLLSRVIGAATVPLLLRLPQLDDEHTPQLSTVVSGRGTDEARSPV